jgi:hypothetical protein
MGYYPSCRTRENRQLPGALPGGKIPD